MSDFVIVDGDQAIFVPAFGAAIVAVQPGTITGSGPAAVSGKKLCVEGDEASVSVPGCLYFTPQFVIPGAGTLKIDSLASDQVAEHTDTGGVPLILKGGQFDAVFEVQSPAQQPSTPSPIPDAATSYSGSGHFVFTNLTFTGT